MIARTRRVAFLPLALLAACAAGPAGSNQDYDPEDRYKVLRTFIPEGTESIILGDVNEAYTMLRSVMPSAMDPGGHLLLLYAASNQDFPQKPGFGDADQVVVYDPGKRGLSSESYPKAGAPGIEEIDVTQDPVLWRRVPPSPDNSPLSQPWMAIRGNRYMMQSGTKELILGSVARSKTGKSYLPVAPPKGFDGNSPVIVMRRLDSGAEPGKERHVDRPTPSLEAYCFTGKATEIGFEGLIWLRAGKPDLLRAYLMRYGLELGGRFEKADDQWWKIPVRVRLGSPPKQGARILYLFALAGCKIAAVPGA
jgi:hypothetical protein